MLKGKRLKFAMDYAVSDNATASAKKAGYSDKTAYSQGQRLLKNVEVQDYIKQLRKEYADTHEVEKDTIINELKKIAFSNPMSCYNFTSGIPEVDVSNVTPDEASTIQSIQVDGDKVRIQFHNKINALEKLAKISGLLDDKVTHEHQGAVNINVITGISGDPASNIDEDFDDEGF